MVLEYLSQKAYKGKSAPLEFSHSELADKLHIARSQVTRAINKLIELGILWETPRIFSFTSEYITDYLQKQVK